MIMNFEHIMANFTLFWGPIFIVFIGIYGLLTQRNLIKILISINIMDLGINIFIIGIGYVKNGSAPIYTKEIPSWFNFVDPLPQALVLTSIVISVAITAFTLFMILNTYKKHQTLDLNEIKDREDDKEEHI